VKIYTRTGDGGETSLFGGGRAPKDDRRVAAYGEVDELNAVIGTAVATAPASFERELLASIQRDLFAVGARLASPDPEKVAGALARALLPEVRIAALEAAIDRVERELEPLEHFVLPGGSPKGAALHVARTVCRRAERSVVTLHRHEPVAPEILRYLNRLSDLLFTLARLANQRARVSEETW
jgi:cob(I)alamin adenosyltransferase